MGQEQSSSNYVNLYETIQDQSNGYGEAGLVKNRKGLKCVYKKFIFTEQEQVERLEKWLGNPLSRHANMVKVVEYGTHEEKQYCSSFASVFIIYEYVPVTVHQLIEDRSRQLLDEEVLWKMMAGPIDLLAQMQGQSIAHENLRPLTVSISGDEMKLIRTQRTAYQMAYQQGKNQKDFYFSPLVYAAIKRNELPQHNVFKSDVFSLGMTLLALGNMRHCYDCYNEIQVSEQQIAGHLQELGANYSERIHNTIEWMVQVEESKRPDFVQLWQMVSEHSQLPPPSPHYSSTRNKQQPKPHEVQAGYYEDHITHLHSPNKQKPTQSDKSVSQANVNQFIQQMIDTNDQMKAVIRAYEERQQRLEQFPQQYEFSPARQSQFQLNSQRQVEAQVDTPPNQVQLDLKQSQLDAFLPDLGKSRQFVIQLKKLDKTNLNTHNTQLQKSRLTSSPEHKSRQLSNHHSTPKKVHATPQQEKSPIQGMEKLIEKQMDQIQILENLIKFNESKFPPSSTRNQQINVTQKPVMNQQDVNPSSYSYQNQEPLPQLTKVQSFGVQQYSQPQQQTQSNQAEVPSTKEIQTQFRSSSPQLKQSTKEVQTTFIDEIRSNTKVDRSVQQSISQSPQILRVGSQKQSQLLSQPQGSVREMHPQQAQGYPNTQGEFKTLLNSSPPLDGLLVTHKTFENPFQSVSNQNKRQSYAQNEINNDYRDLYPNQNQGQAQNQYSSSNQNPEQVEQQIYSQKQSQLQQKQSQQLSQNQQQKQSQYLENQQQKQSQQLSQQVNSIQSQKQSQQFNQNQPYLQNQSQNQYYSQNQINTQNSPKNQYYFQNSQQNQYLEQKQQDLSQNQQQNQEYNQQLLQSWNQNQQQNYENQNYYQQSNQYQDQQQNQYQDQALNQNQDKTYPQYQDQSYSQRNPQVKSVKASQEVKFNPNVQYSTYQKSVVEQVQSPNSNLVGSNQNMGGQMNESVQQMVSELTGEQMVRELTGNQEETEQEQQQVGQRQSFQFDARRIQTSEYSQGQLMNQKRSHDKSESESQYQQKKSSAMGYQQIEPVSFKQRSEVAQRSKNEDFERKQGKRKFMRVEYEDGSYYEGDTLNGILDGHGQLWFANRAHYEGQFRDDRMHGLGKLFYSNANLAYEGEWKFSTFDGQGTLYNENPQQLNGPFNFKDFNDLKDYWVRFTGEFENDFKEGYGVLFLTNNERFEGKFHKDFLHGEGKFWRANGQVVSGSWSQNKYRAS